MTYVRDRSVVAGALLVAAALSLRLLPPAFAAEPPAGNAAGDSGTIAISREQAASVGIGLGEAAPADDYLVAVLPALIMPPPNARVAVAATFPGTVLQTLAVEGQAVRRGQPLAIIASREIVANAGELAQARARLAVARSNAERIRRLGAEGIVSGARQDEAEAALSEAQADFEARSRILTSVNADAAKGTYTLTAPIDGTVASARIETGAPIEGMSAPFVVDSGKAYEVQAQVPGRLIGAIAPGMRIVLTGGVAAKVTSVGTAIAPDTRSALLKGEVDPKAKVIAGMATTASVFAPAHAGAVSVPRGAVAQLDGADVVFVAVNGGFEMRKVKTAPLVGDEAVVLSGLKRGEKIAVAGVSELKSVALSR
jgi:cobalt-zinc-cadmium efflux system membrane fusion protein